MNKFANGKLYIIVPQAEFVQAMVNYSLASDRASLHQIVVDSVQSYVFAADEDMVRTTDVFDDYKWIPAQAMRDIVRVP